jgi:hypothetical protein
MAEDTATPDHAAARTMLEAFASVGARRFNVSWTNSAGEPRRPRSLQKALRSLGGEMPKPANDDWLNSVHIEGLILADTLRTVPALLDTATAERLNLIVRPYGPGASFIQLDDLTAEKLPRIAPAMFLSIETSPGSFQAWLALAGDSDREFGRRVRRAAGADLSASGATRIAGSRNFKDKYAPDFPRVKIHKTQCGHRTTCAELESLGLVAPPEDFVPLPPSPALGEPHRWPSYAQALDGAPLNRAGDGPDRSRADFVWCMAAISWGFGIEETAGRLLTESARARERGKGKSYADATARNAAAAVARRQRQA